MEITLTIEIYIGQGCRIEDLAFDEAVSSVKQQIQVNKEKTSKKLEKLEATIEVVRKMMVEWLQMKTRDCEEGFVNPFGSQSKRKYRKRNMVDKADSGNLQYLKLRFPRFDEGKAVEDCIHDCNQYFDIYGVQEEKKFERYMEQLKDRVPSLTEDYFMECFASGLQKEVQVVVQLLGPDTVYHAYKKARCYEQSRLIERKVISNWKPTKEKSILSTLQGQVVKDENQIALKDNEVVDSLVAKE
ncbi:hypothetical protein AgCh_009032 [Apium graveolens]